MDEENIDSIVEDDEEKSKILSWDSCTRYGNYLRQ